MKLNALHMFAIGAAVALCGAVAFTALKSDTPGLDTQAMPNTAPSSQIAGTAEQGSLFQSLFSSGNTATRNPATGNNPPPAVNKPTQSAIQQVSFSAPDNMDLVVAKYPFLKMSAEDVVAERNSPDLFPIPASMNYAEFRDAKSDTRILLVLMGGGSYCGVAGCFGTIYTDIGGGFRVPGYAFPANTDLYYRNEATNGFSLFNCALEGVEEFRFVDGNIVMIKPPTVQQKDLPGCAP